MKSNAGKKSIQAEVKKVEKLQKQKIKEEIRKAPKARKRSAEDNMISDSKQSDKITIKIEDAQDTQSKTQEITGKSADATISKK